MLPVAILGARQIYEKGSIALIGGRRAHSGRDLLRRDDCVRHVPIGTSTLCPVAETGRIAMDGYRPSTLIAALGSR